MRQLVECLTDWLTKHREDAGAYSLLLALTRETLKRVDSDDAAQREFDAQDLAAAVGRAEASDFDASKRWVSARKLETFVEARRQSIEEHFRAAGLAQCLRPTRRSPLGKHRAVWFLEPYAPAEITPEGAYESELKPQVADSRSMVVNYEFTPPGQVKAAWYSRLLIGAGSFVTRSWRGVLWATLFLVPVAYILVSVLLGLVYTQFRRPLQTADLASLLMIGATAWVIWRLYLRPMIWLLDDRIIPATELWVAWREDNAQLELATGEDGRRRLQLVRYTAVCPICAGTVELRYSQGPNTRRLVGCCDEAPHDHVFSFDRIRRAGMRIGENP